MKFKVVSLNIWLGGTLFEAAFDFLNKESPDIIALQEVYNGKNSNLEKRYRTFDVLKAELRYDYASFAPTFSEKIKEGMIERGNAILSRFPIIAEKTVFYDVPYDNNYILPIGDFSHIPRNLQRAVLKAENNEFNVFNTQGIWGFDGRDTERRLQMGKTIVNEIKDKKNVILAGDFNINPDTKTIAGIEQYLKNVFKNELTATFNSNARLSFFNRSMKVALASVSFSMRQVSITAARSGPSGSFVNCSRSCGP